MTPVCSMKVDINGFVNHLEQAARMDLTETLDKAGHFVEGEARGNAGKISNTGALRGGITLLPLEEDGDTIRAIIQSNASYGVYVEMGTGQRGADDHAGISPDAHPVYRMTPWWIHEGKGEDEVDRATAEKYHWPFIKTSEGRFYKCTGQPAHPYMYPALHDNEEAVMEIIRNGIRRQLK